MFGNLKSKLGDVTDLKKLSSPQALSSIAPGSRQRSTQHSGSHTPLSRHSRQASTASIQGLGLPSSPPLSPNETHSPENADYEREIQKLRTALETQQDAALERLNIREQEWKGKLKEQQDRVSSLEQQIEEMYEKEEDLKQKIQTLENDKGKLEENVSQAQGLEGKVMELQDNLDQMEGLNIQEVAKIKHMLLNTNSELEETQTKLNQKTTELELLEPKLKNLANLEEKLRSMSEEKNELEDKLTAIKHKLSSTNSRLSHLEEERKEEVHHLQERVNILEQRHSQTSMLETDKVQALIKERETVEHKLEEARQQLNNIKGSWSEKITALENQIQNLNAKIAEDQVDFGKLEESRENLDQQLRELRKERDEVADQKSRTEKALNVELSQAKEDIETLKWQLQTSKKEFEEEVIELKSQIEAEKEQQCKLQVDLDALQDERRSLEEANSQFTTEISDLKEKLKTAEAELLQSRNSVISMEELISQERTCKNQLEINKKDLTDKLETISSEKNKLSKNLDEYFDKVSALEDKNKALEEDAQKKCIEIETQNSKIVELEVELENLNKKLVDMEEDFEVKVEESELVQSLRGNVQVLQEQLNEKNQALKVQGQRLADMKKTIQRELKLNTDSVDLVGPENKIDSKGSTQNLQTTSRTPATLPTTSGVTTAVNSFPSITNHDGTVVINGKAEDANLVTHMYLKNVIIKFLTSREYEAVKLTKAVATLLGMTDEEERLLKETLEWKMSWFGSRPNLGSGQLAKTIPPSQ
ncbi:golgin subfamily A member 1-like [Oratosquilla oratoria]|uniref:golgin subfamily A member 1-like n=1 Tax=Oratosquilla oratoria TaxID=337810 RepID=UPI003F76A753